MDSSLYQNTLKSSVNLDFNPKPMKCCHMTSRELCIKGRPQTSMNCNNIANKTVFVNKYSLCVVFRVAVHLRLKLNNFKPDKHQLSFIMTF